MEKKSGTWMCGLVALLTGIMTSQGMAEVVVDLEFITGAGTADLGPARGLDVNTTNEATYAWSDSALLFDGDDAKNQDVYGAYTTTGPGVIAGTFLEVQDTNTDADFLRMDGSNTSADQSVEGRAFLLWKSADFLASGFNTFNASANSALTVGIDSYNNKRGARFVIRDGSQFYVSSYEFSDTGSFTIDGTTAGLQWGEFNPAAGDWALFDSSAGDVGMGVTFSDMTFSNVTGVGMIAEIDRSNGNQTVIRINDFQAALIPEPMTLGLIAMGGGALLAIRRMRSL